MLVEAKVHVSVAKFGILYVLYPQLEQGPKFWDCPGHSRTVGTYEDRLASVLAMLVKCKSWKAMIFLGSESLESIFIAFLKTTSLNTSSIANGEFVIVKRGSIILCMA